MNGDTAAGTRDGEVAFGKAGVPSSRWFFACKSVADRLVAALLLLPALPLMALLVAIIRATSKGPGIYSQERVGKDGRPFTMYKLRSMRCDAEARTGPVWAGVGGDARVTRLGYWLRLLHLDELPQLFNVLRGEMSLVGPRPERPEFVKVLGEQIPGYRERLRVRPGITGLAQINLPPDTDLSSVRRKLVLDREYIAIANWWIDIRILASTALRLCGLRGGRAVRWLGLHREVVLGEQELSLSHVRPMPQPHVALAVDGDASSEMDELKPASQVAYPVAASAAGSPR